jgi:hypothetical protein
VRLRKSSEGKRGRPIYLLNSQLNTIYDKTSKYRLRGGEEKILQFLLERLRGLTIKLKFDKNLRHVMRFNFNLINQTQVERVRICFYFIWKEFIAIGVFKPNRWPILLRSVTSKDLFDPI